MSKFLFEENIAHTGKEIVHDFKSKFLTKEFEKKKAYTPFVLKGRPEISWEKNHNLKSKV